MNDSNQHSAKENPPGSQHLDQPLLSSLAWTGSIKWACQLITWVFTLVVARILTPDDYGLMAIASIYLSLVTMLCEFGMGKAVVVIHDLEDNQIAQVNGLAILFGFSGMALSLAIASPVSHLFFSDAEQAAKLTEIIQILSITFILGSLRTIPFALLEKDLRFKTLAITDAGRTLATASTTLTCAMLGFGYWSLVAGMLMDSLVASILGLILRRSAVAWPRFKAIRSIMKVSWHLVVDILSYYVYKSSDQAIAGRILGAGPLGAYALANQFANIPVDKISAIVTRVTPAFFAAVGNDPAGLRRYLLVITQGLSLIIFPLTIGISLVAEEFVLVALGEKWSAMIVPLRLLAISAAFAGVYTVLPRVLWATGNTRFTMRVGVLAAIFLTFAFYIGSFWGTAGIAAAWVVAYPLSQTPVYWLAFRKIHLSLLNYMRALWPALSSCASMALVLLVLDSILAEDFSRVLELILKIFVGGTTYGLTILLMHRETASRTLQTFRQLRGSKTNTQTTDEQPTEN